MIRPAADIKWQNMRVLVTGACGTIGSELVRTLLKDFNVAALIGIDNNETELFFLEQSFLPHDNASFFLADIRDEQALTDLFHGVDIIFHTAAYKHVVLCERSPHESIQTNINGVQNVIRAAKRCKVKYVIYTSSDKAVNPTNVMGASKLMGERMITAANKSSDNYGTIFLSVRFGNVLGSQGSVVPIFHEQIKNAQPVTLTDPKMTRFIMNIRSAANLIINSLMCSYGGEIFITKMPVVQIDDLAEVMINALALHYGHNPSDIKTTIIGRKPGEKMFEELMTSEEIRRTIELDRYFAILPPEREADTSFQALYDDVVSSVVSSPYISANTNVISKPDLFALLSESALLTDYKGCSNHLAQRYWPANNIYEKAYND